LVTVAGLVGVVGYVAARRTREVGIRMALGAPPGNVIWLMMRDAAAATIAGAAAGLVGAMWLSGSVTSLVYGVSPTDWPTLAMATGGLMALAVAAAAGPARRAGRLSPVIALREP
jgi:ABC-type antimicrobial peptide transport system permease subunit